MATAFKSLDTIYTPPAARPRIRVAFSAGVATQAVARAAETMPVGVQAATLDELAQGSSGLFTATLDAADAAKARFNALSSDLEARAPDQHRAESALMHEATARADVAIPTSWPEFTRLLAHMTEGGRYAIDDDNAERLLGYARRLCGVAHDHQTSWQLALANYRHLRAISDALPLGAPDEDEAIDAWCGAMDRLIAETPAPDLDAVITKVDLGRTRFEGLLLDEFTDAIRADLNRLASGEQIKPADPHRGWLDERNALFARLEAGDSTDETGLSELNRIDIDILQTEPTTADGMLAQFVLLAQIVTEGAEPSEEMATAMIRNAQRLAGMGWVLTDGVSA